MGDRHVCVASCFVIAVASLAGCSSSTLAPAPECGSVSQEPAFLTVTSATTGAPICNASFTTIAAPQPYTTGPVTGVRCTSDRTQVADAGCAPYSADGGAASCTYLVSLGAIPDPLGPFTLEVSAPGYVSQTVSNVSAGYGGCATSNPSTITLSLTPLATDAG
jgi:hypothetical protein